MLKHGVTWVTGTSVIIFCMWCYLFCSNNCMFAYSLSSYANVSQSWKNTGNGIYYNDYMTFAISILYPKGEGDFPFGFGFLTNQTSVVNYSYILAIYIEPLDHVSSPVVVWCANRNHPVQRNAILNFTSQGDLVLRDADGSLVWSTNTSGLSVMSMELESNGNLVLSNARGEPMWESFNYPTDTLLYHQQLSEGQRLVSYNSTSNYSEGMFYASRESGDIHAFVDSNPPQQYSIVKYDDIWNVSNFIDYIWSESNFNETGVATYSIGYLMYVRLDQDGHLRRYGWNQSRGELFIADIFYNGLSFGDCEYPTTCGKYGVCTNNRTCGCPTGSDGGLDYFNASKAYDAESGCTLATSLSCPDTHKLHTFLKIENLTYFDHTPSLTGTDVESCKIACLSNCSCKAVFFRYYNDASLGNCTLPSELFTLMDVSERAFEPKTLAFIKVQNRIKTASTKAIEKRKLVVSVSASLIAIAFVTGVCYYMFILRRRRRAKSIDCSQDVFVDTVTRFSYETLVTTTQDFQTRLGRGGFGSVFEGTLGDGTKVAVKRLDSLGQGRKEFLAEVNTIGSIHHFNLVKLIGFCDDGLNRLLVYEYMCSGSLEKWIFNQDVTRTLTWNLRRRIIDGVASGLEYLHEHCNQNIIHFDIKPQNILLDKDFNVKISDFGLAKMVDRDHSQVVTIVRGTPGYMAPELITGRAISCKVDVYSFGVLVLETVCGRKNFGSSEGDCLTQLVKTKADGDQLSDLIDEHGEDMMQQHKEEVVNMMKIAIWCLQPHFIRPSMSMVVKVLQDATNMEPITDLSYLNMVHEAVPPVEENYEFSVRPTESLLSGPRS